LFELLAMLWLIWDQCRTDTRQFGLMRAYTLGAVAASCIAFFRYVTNQQTNYRRFAATGFDPNDFGIILALAIPLALYLGLKERGWAAWVFRAAVPVLAAAVFLTASRTALIATFVAFGFAVWMWRQSSLAQRGVTAAVVLALGLSLFHFGPAPQRKRLATIGTELKRGTLHNRTRIWKTGAKVFKQHPVLGVGVAAFPEAVSPWLGKSDSAGFLVVAHNTFLSVLVETGAVGFAIYALLLGALGVFIWMMPSPERALWTVIVVVWAVGVSTLTWEHYKPTWLMMALIMTGWARAGWAGPERK
jgi:O-antigen ligase